MERRLICRGAVLLAGVAAMAACHKPAATGQVLATVGGKDITLQDVRAEGRADGVPAAAGHGADVALLQRVIDRDLLAQSAHDQKLDQTPESPSDLSRVEQTWRADKSAKLLLVGLQPPTDAEAQRFIADHPYAFAKRQRISGRTLTLKAAPALYTQLKTYTNFDAAQAFLKRLGVAMNAGSGQIDTAQLAPAVAAQLEGTPDGTLLVTQPSGRIQVTEVQGHTPVEVGAKDQLTEAKRGLFNAAVSRRVSAELTRLKSNIKVTYQPGYAPTPPGAPSEKTAPQPG